MDNLLSFIKINLQTQRKMISAYRKSKRKIQSDSPLELLDFHKISREGTRGSLSKMLSKSRRLMRGENLMSDNLNQNNQSNKKFHPLNTTMLMSMRMKALKRNPSKVLHKSLKEESHLTRTTLSRRKQSKPQRSQPNYQTIKHLLK